MNEILKQSQTVQSCKNYRPFSGKSFYLSESDIKDAIKIAEAIGKGLIDKFQADKVMLFGSLAKNKMIKNSDIDIAVWGIPDKIFYKAAAYATGYSSKWNVDLVDFNDCKESIKTAILTEGIILT
ncbi:MAG: nucleotidyltransferase domain-containing protein [Deltaproteobacteria bacterium]|nr:nucleotidyltransferase domain-containing protein [Deltaproteobacteria bacterium]MCL5892797.1 nucleotidyltransferase domain-containing protein [Deltaproteobacteria bacterium]